MSKQVILVLLLRVLGYAVAAEQDSLVSPIVNRELEASVVAHAWPSTVDSVLCEAWGYHYSNWNFMDELVAKLVTEKASSTTSQARQLAVDATTDSIDKSLMEYALSLRAYSPLCELHRGLARQALIDHKKQNVAFDAFVVAGDLLLTDASQLVSVAANAQLVVDLLPGEVPRGNSADAVAVLYASMTTQSFVTWYQALVQAEIPFVVRHLGNVWYEEKGGTPTVLQGYGVRLDIRNVEYRVFDDRDEEPSETASMMNTTSLSTTSSQFLAGVNVSALNLPRDEALSLQAQLLKTHEAHQLHAQIIPPTWQRRQLSLQAATAIASSQNDVLLTLQDVSQNLPSVASTLVHLEVPESHTALAQEMEGLLSRTKGTLLFVNGRRVPIDRPSFNVFEFLNLMKEEQAELSAMQRRLSPYLNTSALRQVQRAWSMGADALVERSSEDGNDSAETVFRIDVGRGGQNAILYVNDIEKDEQYASWPVQVQQMIFAMQYGMPPTVRRNIFTILQVMDPLADDGDEEPAIMLAGQLMQGQFPVRLGVLFVNQEDINKCAKWVAKTQPEDSVPCQVNRIFAEGSMPGMDVMANLDATTQAAYNIFAHVVANYRIMAWPYLHNWMAMIPQFKEMRQDEFLTLHDLVTIHGQIMSGLEIMDEQQAIQEAIEALRSEENTGDAPSYGMALRFAVNKAVQPGAGFLNGRPLPSGDDESSREAVGRLFMEEQSHIMELVMKGEITNTSPRSVYAKLLKGEKVFDRVHPLLTDSQDGKNSYISLSHSFDAESLLIPPTSSAAETPDAAVLIEAVLDFETTSGREMAASFISTMNTFSYEGKQGDTVSIAYRVLPSTASSASSPLCKVLSHASKLSVASLTELLKREDGGQMTLDAILDSIPEVSNAMRTTISSDESSCSTVSHLEEELPSTRFFAANGRVYSPQDASLTKGDLELLLNIELGRAKGITKLLMPHLTVEGNAHFDALAQASQFLAEQHSKEQSSRSDLETSIGEIEQNMGIESNPLRFSWNEGEEGDSLKIKVSAVLDPISEPTQRMAPLLKVIRDNLQLPLSVILAPQAITDDNIPITSYYRFVADFQTDDKSPVASFENLPSNHVLTLVLDVPEPWNVQQTKSVQDTDNLRCDITSGCGDDPYDGEQIDRKDLTRVEYGLSNLLVFGQCYDATKGSPPNGLQLTLSKRTTMSPAKAGQVEISPDGSIVELEGQPDSAEDVHYSDTLVMKTVGYWQLRANPGVWNLNIAPESRGAEIFDMMDGTVKNGKLKLTGPAANNATKTIVMKDFVNRGELLLVKRRPGYEKATLFYEDKESKAAAKAEDEVINVFSLATGHLYERFLKIMMLSVTKRTSSKVKFWLFENFLSPTFKSSAVAMAERIGCEVEFVTYKWPEWIRGQSEKQRIIWGYKILFLDVLFPLGVKKIIYVDADQVVRGDLKELWDMDLKGAAYGYTPFCTSRETTLGFQFWRSGFWKNHLGDLPYHISALYVVDLDLFRKKLVGDQLRSIYQQLSADPNSLANLDQDLPNYAQHQVPIFSLPQEWLWCESWCSDETKATAKTIDLCNNPLHKEPKVSMAKRIISGELFPESWVELDQEVERYEREYLESLAEDTVL